MEIVQRILAKIVGEEISIEEMELVSGGAQNHCEILEGWASEYSSAGVPKCDFN